MGCAVPIPAAVAQEDAVPTEAAADAPPDYAPPFEPTGAFLESFVREEAADRFYVSDFDFGGEGVVTGYRRDNVEFSSAVSDGIGGFRLKLTAAPEEDDKPFYGGEVQIDAGFSYGDYEVVMRPAKASGVVSSFFTYTGGTFGHPHHEIDIEFLGKDTTGLYVNIYYDGKPQIGKLVPLGFDASTDFHVYRFEWREEGVTWYVDGEEIYRVSAGEVPIPSYPGKLYANLWAVAPGQEGWAGKVDPALTVTADYRCMSFVPLGEDARQCSDLWN
ncbi:putative licheninase [Celeribacter indicus]|uniref:Beta-glucanase n=1 Tax=Celeribacter indicus TaxID=1208324 RepID=A0A0B5E409_9RHOB|nr:putative licheninase [Celeribacter indicus]